MKEAIKRAIEGGWEGVRAPKITPENINDISLLLSHQKRFLLDPLFWQALGKAEGWKHEMKEMEHLGAGGKVIKYKKHQPGERLKGIWLLNWHRFIDHIANGEKIDSFFKELLK